MAEDKEISDTEKKELDVVKKKRKGGGFFSRIWSRFHGDDFEKRLQNVSKEEAAVLERMKRRLVSWRRTSRNLIAFFVVFEEPRSRFLTNPARRKRTGFLRLGRRRTVVP